MTYFIQSVIIIHTLQAAVKLVHYTVCQPVMSYILHLHFLFGICKSVTQIVCVLRSVSAINNHSCSVKMKMPF